MKRRSGFLFGLLALLPGTVTAQDARSVLQAAADSMGTARVHSIQYSGTGFDAAVGQNYYPEDDWPRIGLKSYTRTIDYDSKSSREELVRVQGNNSRRAGDGIPVQGEEREVRMVSGNYSWTEGNEANPAPSLAEFRQLEIWLSPHGFIKAAMAGNPSTVSRTDFTLQINGNSKATEMGKKVNLVAFTALGKYRVIGSINDRNLLQHVQTRVPDPVLGDTLVETFFTDYKDFGGVMFPTVIHHHYGMIRKNPTDKYLPCCNAFDLKVTDVQPNVKVAMSVPDLVRRTTVPPIHVESKKIADGVWFLGGGSHNSMAVEFRDFVTIVEAPVDEQRSLAVIVEVKKIIPNKPIRYIVNTHHHLDHIGGLRTYVAEGAIIITHYFNRAFYEQVIFGQRPWTLAPDRLSLFPIDPTIEAVTERYLVFDGTRTMELHPVRDLDHTATMLIAYLPQEKVVFEADLYTPPGSDPSLLTVPVSSTTAFYENIRRLNLDITQIVPVHGKMSTMSEFLGSVGKQDTR